MAQLTSNTSAFIEAQQYSQFILENLHDYHYQKVCGET